MKNYNLEKMIIPLNDSINTKIYDVRRHAEEIKNNSFMLNLRRVWLGVSDIISRDDRWNT